MMHVWHKRISKATHDRSEFGQSSFRLNDDVHLVTVIAALSLHVNMQNDFFYDHAL
jgi:hypothetical protein